MELGPAVAEALRLLLAVTEGLKVIVRPLRQSESAEEASRVVLTVLAELAAPSALTV